MSHPVEITVTFDGAALVDASGTADTMDEALRDAQMVIGKVRQILAQNNGEGFGGLLYDTSSDTILGEVDGDDEKAS